MTYTLSNEIAEQKAAHLVHECWSGRVQSKWIKTLRTLRGYWIGGNWDEQAARRLIRSNLRSARISLNDNEIYTPVIDLAEDTLLETVERMFRAERASK